jgi:hypothetical protein
MVAAVDLDLLAQARTAVPRLADLGRALLAGTHSLASVIRCRTVSFERTRPGYSAAYEERANARDLLVRMAKTHAEKRASNPSLVSLGPSSVDSAGNSALQLQQEPRGLTRAKRFMSSLLFLSD